MPVLFQRIARLKQLLRHHRRFAGVLAVLAAYAGYLAFLAPTPERQIERLLQKGCRAVEEKSIFSLNGVLAANFHADGIDRSAALGYARHFFEETGTLSVKLTRVIHDQPKLPPSASTARAIVIVEVSGVTAADRQAFKGIGGAGADTFLLTFARRGGKGVWEVSGAERLDAGDVRTLSRGIGQAGRENKTPD